MALVQNYISAFNMKKWLLYSNFLFSFMNNMGTVSFSLSILLMFYLLKCCCLLNLITKNYILFVCHIIFFVFNKSSGPELIGNNLSFYQFDQSGHHPNPCWPLGGAEGPSPGCLPAPGEGTH